MDGEWSAFSIKNSPSFRLNMFSSHKVLDRSFAELSSVHQLKVDKSEKETAKAKADDERKLDDAPSEISMVFKSPAKLIKLELLKEQASAKKSLLGGLFGNDGGKVVPLPNAVLMEMSDTHVIPLPKITGGGYQVKCLPLF